MLRITLESTVVIVQNTVVQNTFVQNTFVQNTFVQNIYCILRSSQIARVTLCIWLPTGSRAYLLTYLWH